MSILLVIIILVVLVLVHELGHFSVAKLFGIRVDQFNIGFPPRLLKIQKGETLYSFNLLLLGGYVQIHGENPDEAKGDPRALSSKPRWVQALVMVAGIVFNLVFAWLILSAGYMVGMPTAVDHDGIGTVTNAHPTIVSVLPDSPADKAGLKPLDAVESIETASDKLDARTLNTDQQAQAVHDFMTSHAGDSLVVTVLRGGKEQTFLARAQGNIVPGHPEQQVIGVRLEDVGVLKLAPPQALYEGGVLTKGIIQQSAVGLGMFIGRLFSGAPDFSQVAGPIGLVSIGGTVLSEGFSQVLVLAASISIALGLFNLLPVPGLDGGRIFILLIESIIRRAVPQRVVLALTFAGFALLITLMVAVSAHDIAKLVG